MWEKVCLTRKNANKFNKKHLQGGMKKYKEWNTSMQITHKIISKHFDLAVPVI